MALNVAAATTSYDVLLDVSPIISNSRFRGIGRYVQALLTQFEQEAKGLRIGGLGHTAHEESLVDNPPRADTSSQSLPMHIYDKKIGLQSKAKQLGSRLVHVTDPGGWVLNTGSPKIITCHDLIPQIFPEMYLRPLFWGPRKRKLQDYLHYGRAIKIIAVSQCTANDLMRLYDIPKESIDVIYHGVDHTRFVQAPKQEDAELKMLASKFNLTRPYFLYVGAADKRKNLATLIEAFAQSELHKDMDLVIAGGHRPEEEKGLRNVMQRTRVEESVKLVGFLTENLVPILYRQCFAHTFVSLYEGFGLPLLEAMACGRPSITSNTSSLKEIGGDAVLAVDPSSPGDIANAMIQLREDTNLYQALIKRGLAHASQFTWQSCAAQTLQTYQKVLDSL